jgi:tripartite-type tricarboxylate transporter receptor subunit TctC
MPDQNTGRRKFLRLAGAAGVVGLAGCTGGDGGDGGDGGAEDTPTETAMPTATPTEGGTTGDTETATPTEGSDSSELEFDWTPSRNVSVVVPWGAGGGTDTMTRGVMNPAEDILRQNGVDVSINVQNITGANGLNAASYVRSQPDDGHTVFANTTVIERNIVTGTANFTLADWQGISRVQHATSWWYSSGRDGTGYKSIEEVVEGAKNDPPLQIGAVGGGLSQVFSLRVIEAADIIEESQFVSYQDAGEMRNDVISGNVDVAIGEIQEMLPQVEEGDVELVLAGTEQDQIERFPDVPTTGDMGWDVTYGVMRGFVAQEGTPEEAITFWDKLIHAAMQTESYQSLATETLANLRPGYLGSEEWTEAMKAQIERIENALDLWEQVSGSG